MQRSLLRQLARFAIVGATNTAVTFVAYTAAVGVGVHYLPAAAAAFVLGAVNGFVLNRAWTFRHGGRPLASGSRYAVVQLAGLGTNLVLLWFAVHLAGLGRLPGEAAAAPPVTLMMFALSRTWVFPATRGLQPRVMPVAGGSPSPAP
jgi:putative flippase GtrA